MILTSTEVRDRLDGTALPDGPADIIMPPGSSRWPEPMREQLSGSLKPAGVLVPLLQHAEGLSVLLTRRSAELKHHAGQISFPGGRMEDEDRDVEATALRETHEEVGIPAALIDVVGYLQTMPTVTGYAVTPVVGLLASETQLVVDRQEVAYAFEVPLTYLLDEANDIRTELQYHDRTVPMVEFQWQDERIWGATAFMILELRKRLLNK